MSTVSDSEVEPTAAPSSQPSTDRQPSADRQPGTDRPSVAPRPPVATRLPAAERRERILASASEVFGVRGYAGTTTDQVAQAAGISQPYVVRMFGTKENLFVEVLNRAQDKLKAEFRSVIADNLAVGGNREELGAALGRSYIDLIEDRGILLSLMQGFVMGHDPVIGETARRGFLAMYAILRDEAGFSASDVRDFLAHGMLFNTLIGIQLPQIYGLDVCATELMETAFASKLDKVLRVEGQDAE
jgi:TetR/AcrR family transcriptional regulator